MYCGKKLVFVKNSKSSYSRRKKHREGTPTAGLIGVSVAVGTGAFEGFETVKCGT